MSDRLKHLGTETEPHLFSRWYECPPINPSYSTEPAYLQHTLTWFVEGKVAARTTFTVRFGNVTDISICKPFNKTWQFYRYDWLDGKISVLSDYPKHTKAAKS